MKVALQGQSVVADLGKIKVGIVACEIKVVSATSFVEYDTRHQVDSLKEPLVDAVASGTSGTSRTCLRIVDSNEQVQYGPA